jgi:hypothetical protein
MTCDAPRPLLADTDQEGGSQDGRGGADHGDRLADRLADIRALWRQTTFYLLEPGAWL